MPDITPTFNFQFDPLTLTQQIDRIPNLWQVLEPFEVKYPPTTTVEVQFRDGVVTVLEADARGAPGPEQMAETETGFLFKIPHIPSFARIKPEDLQDRWIYQSGQRQLMTAADATARALLRLKRNHAQTLELLRWGALKGQLLTGRGTVLYDFYEVFGLTRKSFDIRLSDNGTDVEAICDDIRIYLEQHLFGETMDGIRARISPTLFRKLIVHPNVEKYYLNWRNAQALAAQAVRREFVFGGITWLEETHSVSNIDHQVVKFVDDGKGVVYPSGTSEMFETNFGPAHHIEAVNLPGVELFVTPKILDHGAGVELKAQSNPLPINTRPELSVEVYTS